MPKYLIEVSYTAEGVKGLLKDGGSKRRAVAEKAINSVGAKMDALYYAFGGRDIVGIIDAPDNAAMAAASLTINASGAVTLKTTPLLTVEEIDQATKTQVAYTPPGQ